MEKRTVREGWPEPGRGLAIVDGGRRVLLKWHRLRRTMSDPLFGLAALEEGLRIGASMEVDLRVGRDGCFALLHDETLDGETDGSGPVAGRDAVELAKLAYRDGASAPRRRLVLVDEIAGLVAGADPAALLQFDMKDDLETVGEPGIAHLERLFEGRNVPVVFSGDCLPLVERIAGRLPGVATGIDPTNRLVALYRSEGAPAMARLLERELAAAAAHQMVYLSWRLVLSAKEDGVDLVGLCHAAGRKVDAWTFTLAQPDKGFDDREWAAFSALLSCGVDQITTDEAVATERAFARRSARS